MFLTSAWPLWFDQYGARTQNGLAPGMCLLIDTETPVLWRTGRKQTDLTCLKLFTRCY